MLEGDELVAVDDLLADLREYDCGGKERLVGRNTAAKAARKANVKSVRPQEGGAGGAGRGGRKRELMPGPGGSPDKKKPKGVRMMVQPRSHRKFFAYLEQTEGDLEFSVYHVSHVDGLGKPACGEQYVPFELGGEGVWVASKSSTGTPTLRLNGRGREEARWVEADVEELSAEGGPRPVPYVRLVDETEQMRMALAAYRSGGSGTAAGGGGRGA